MSLPQMRTPSRRSSPFHLCALALTLLASCAPPSAELEDDELAPGVVTESLAPAGVSIRSVQSIGSGCPQGTVTWRLSEDREALTGTFVEMVAEAGPGIPLSAGRRNCTSSIVLNVPAGWQYAVANHHHRAFVDLDRGARAEMSIQGFFEGNARTWRFGRTEQGPLQQDYVSSDSIGAANLTWSACGVSRALSVNTTARVSRTNTVQYPNATGIYTLDAIDGEVTHVLGLTFRRCQ